MPQHTHGGPGVSLRMPYAPIPHRPRGILQISCPNRDALRFCYDTGTIELRIFVGFAQILLRIHYDLQESITNTARTLGISYESVNNMPNASTNQVLLKLNS